MPTPELDLPLLYSGKVRRLYALDDPATMLVVATDAISAFDFVLSSEIPDKGAILNQMSLWWFKQLEHEIPHHVLSTEVPSEVSGRAVVVEKLSMVPVECVARGYLTGSGWVEYQQSQTVCGIELPAGLRDGDKLPEPIFTPATKAPQGEHDENIDFSRVCHLVGDAMAAQLRDATLRLYKVAAKIAEDRGIILADTKFEFGTRPDGQLVLADEVLTPDSSRWWELSTWKPGERMDDFSKQYVRNWLLHESGWDKDSNVQPPALPAHVIRQTRERYLEAFRRITSKSFESSGAEPQEASEDAQLSLEESQPVVAEPASVPVSQPTPVAAEPTVAAAQPALETAQQTPDESQSTPAGETLVTEQVGSLLMARVVVDVMPKPEILDPQGKAVTGALHRMGFAGLTVRQGKRFEIDFEGDISDDKLAEVEKAAEQLLANTVIENYSVRVEQ